MRQLLLLLPIIAAAQPAMDVTAVSAGPVTVTAAGLVSWPDEAGRTWQAQFNLKSPEPPIAVIRHGGRAVVERAQPLFWCTTGKRRGGWDQFFDLPPSHPDGTRSFTGELQWHSAVARTTGDRVEVEFDGYRCGPFRGVLRYTFYPGSRLIRQEAIVSTEEPDTAYFYDAGIRMAAEDDRRPGGNMASQVAYFDTAGRFVERAATGPERAPVAVRHRAIAARLAGGSLTVLPEPHRYFFPRDFTTNMAHVWQSAWRGFLSLGIRQLPDDNTRFYPWVNAPPGTRQRMGLFLLVSDGPPSQALKTVLEYTNSDRFPKLDGFQRVSAHWHFAYTDQAMANGPKWTPPFKPVLKAMGVDASVIMDFHGDGHPRDTTDLRLKELKAYYDFCRAQSDSEFLLIPSEEANVHLGGHWALTFPRPVFWIMSRPPGTEFVTQQPPWGKVYRVGSAEELLEMVRREDGQMYQTHPRTKGSMGFPDKIRETSHFRDDRYLGAGWKAMNADLASPRLGDRSLNLLDDMSQWGANKRLIGEVDVFQIDETHELWAHMNVNYVRMPRLPKFDDYGEVLKAFRSGSFFVSTGEVLLPSVEVSGELDIHAEVRWTFPLAIAEIVWGDAGGVHRKELSLDKSRQFGRQTFHWNVGAPGWNWARLAVWDVAGNGAWVNPIYRISRKASP